MQHLSPEPATLITGASGFIGHKLLKPGRIPLVRSAQGLPQERTGDLLDASSLIEACANIKRIVHCAGYAHAFSSADPMLHEEINHRGTQRLLDAAIKNHVEEFIFISSVKATGDPGEECIDEHFTAPPQTPYGRAKHAAEIAALAAGRKTGMKVVILRPVMVYGRGGGGNLLRMAKGIRQGWFPRLPETGNRRSLVHIDDLIRAIELAIDLPQSRGQTYIVAHPTPRSGADIDRALRHALGRQEPCWGPSAPLLRQVGTYGDIIARLLRRPLPINREVIDTLLGSACYRPAKIEQELGWRAEIDLPAGLQEMLG